MALTFFCFVVHAPGIIKAMSLTFFAYPYGVHAPPHFDDFPSILAPGGYPQKPENQHRTPKSDILEPWGRALAQNLDFLSILGRFGEPFWRPFCILYSCYSNIRGPSRN